MTETNKDLNPEEEIKVTDNEEATAQEAAAPEAETEKTDADKLAEAEEQIAALKDKYLRQVAEFDNYRKRTMKEKAELILTSRRCAKGWT